MDKQSFLAEMVKSESAGDAGQDHHGENLSFAVFNSQSKSCNLNLKTLT